MRSDRSAARARRDRSARRPARPAPGATQVDALEDGRIPIHNNACENGLRGIAVGRKNYLFAGSDAGAERAAILYTVLATARLHEIAEPWAYLRDVLAKLASGWPASRLAELLPDVWRPAPAVAPLPAASAALPVAG